MGLIFHKIHPVIALRPNPRTSDRAQITARRRTSAPCSSPIPVVTVLRGLQNKLKNPEGRYDAIISARLNRRGFYENEIGSSQAPIFSHCFDPGIMRGHGSKSLVSLPL